MDTPNPHKTRTRRDAGRRFDDCINFHAMLVKEESLLEPRDPSLQNADDWPSFPIKNIRVTSQKTGKDVSLLSAHPENVVNVSGKLDQIDDELLHLGMPTQFVLHEQPSLIMII